MVGQKKFNLSRFKRDRDGLTQFAMLIEQAEPKAREDIIKRTGEQDAEFLFLVMRRVVYFEELIYLEPTVLAEILSAISPKVLAFAQIGMTAEFRKKIMENLNYRLMRQVMDEEDKAGNPAPALIEGARRQILKLARSIEAKGKIHYELADCPRFERRQRPGQKAQAKKA